LGHQLGSNDLEDTSLESPEGGPVFPIFIGLQIFFLLLVQGLVFRWCRNHTTRKAIQARFWFTMAILLVFHVAAVGTMVSGLTSDWVVTGFVLGRIRLLAELGWTGHILAWVTMISLLAMVWRFALAGLVSMDALPWSDSD